MKIYCPRKPIILLSTLVLILGSNSWAQESDNLNEDPGPKFGPEFTFWDNNDQSIRAKIIARATEHLVNGQEPASAKFSVISNPHSDYITHFISPNGWDFYIIPDSGVVEVTMRPLHLVEYEKYAADMQDAIFVTAANENAFPAPYGGGGHINIEGEYFFKKPLLLRNFIVDFINHAELSLGIFNFDTNNAFSFSLIPQYTYSRLINHIEAYDNFGWKNISKSKLLEFLHEFNRILADSTDSYKNYWRKSTNNYRSKYSELNVDKLVMRHSEDSRLELRAVRAQASMDVWVRQIRLIKKRLNYLNTFSEPIPIHPNFQVTRASNGETAKVDEETATKPPIDAQSALKEFEKYVTESGENILDHLDYVWPKWIFNGEVEKFISSIASPGACSQILDPPK